MRHYRKESRYVSVLTVHVPSAMALVDMLRYDRCKHKGPAQISVVARP